MVNSIKISKYINPQIDESTAWLPYENKNYPISKHINKSNTTDTDYFIKILQTADVVLVIFK